MEKDYTYGVARIRALESGLLTDEAVDQLLHLRTFEEGLQFLKDRGWGNGNDSLTLDEMMAVEKEKTYRVLEEIVDEPEEYAILTLQDLYHNLKAAVKQVCTGQETANVFIEGVGAEPEFLKECIREGNYERLPKGMAEPAKEATEILLRTGDGQLCDLVIDRAALNAMKEAGRTSENELIQKYADIQVAVADIKIAVRGVKSGKDERFLDNALVSCAGISISELKAASVNGLDAVCSYLESAGYQGGVEALKISASVFECWCDNLVIEEMKSQKYKAFTIGPIIAYAVARFHEMKTAKLILLGKQNGFEEEFIKERVRRMYA